MLFTVAGLKDEEDDPIVEPDVPMRDDGCEGRFAKAYIHDEIPWMDLRHEVRDLMFLAVPEIAVTDDDVSFQDEFLPDDGMETFWAAESEPAVQDPVGSVAAVPEFQAAIAAPAESAAMIAAPAAVHMIPMPAEVPDEAESEVGERTLAIPAAAQTAMIKAPVVVPSLPEPIVMEEDAVIAEVPVEEAPVDIAEAEAVEEAVMAEIPLVVEETLEEVADIPEAEAVGEITMTVPETLESEVPAPVMEDVPAVRFSFGSQEIRGSGWRVCFSF